MRVKSPVAEGSVQPLSVHEHPPLLWEAIATAQDRVLIICPWITDRVVDRPALASIENLLKRDVRLYIGYGIDEDEEGRKRRKAVPQGLLDLAQKYENFQLRDFGDTHEKVLIKDCDFEVVGSFNWLSFRGDPERKLRREHSVKVIDPVYVESQFAVLEARFRTKPRKRGQSEGS